MPDETRPPVPLMPSATSDREAEAASFLAAIDALLPELRSRAAEVEQRGMVPDDIIRSLTAVGVFRALQPRQWGGWELDFAAYYEGMIPLALPALPPAGLRVSSACIPGMLRCSHPRRSMNCGATTRTR